MFVAVDPKADNANSEFPAIWFAARTGRVLCIQVPHRVSKTNHLKLFNHISMQALIKGKCDINAQTTRGQTALFKACQEGYIDIVRELIKANQPHARCSHPENL